MVSKLDSTKHTWTTVADRLFNNKFTVCNIMQGREYHFRVYAKNDMGISEPSESPTWGMEKKKGVFVFLKVLKIPFNYIKSNNFVIFCRKTCPTWTNNEGLGFAVFSDVHRSSEASSCNGRLRMPHELCGEGKPHTPHHVVSKSCQSKHWYQLLHLQHLWSLLVADPPCGAQRHGGVQRCCREQLRTSRMLHGAQRQGWEGDKTALKAYMKRGG